MKHQKSRCLLIALAVVALVTAAGGGPALAAPHALQRCTNLASFVADVTVPDNSVIPAGTSFVKTWRLRNSGTCTWKPSYSVVFVSGAQMGAPSPVYLPHTVLPGATVDVSAPMIAPMTPGTYRGNWMLSTSGGLLFGLGSNGSGRFYVQIVVPGSTTPTPVPTAERITFQAGQTSASRTFQFVPGQPKVYVLRAMVGQEMWIYLARPVSSLTVQAPNGAALTPVYADGANTRWRFVLPTTGDYRIVLQGSGSNTITVEIPAASPTPQPPTRITFPPGGTSATVSMTLQPGQAKVYVLGASAGQQMFLYLTSPVSRLMVYAPNGSVVYPTSIDVTQTQYTFYLTAGGDWRIELWGSGPNGMTVVIPPR
jgi:hypothetical protein